MPGPSYPAPARARYAQITLALVGFSSVMDSAVVGLLIEPIKQELALTDVQVGLAYGTAFYAAYGLFAIPAGMFADRFVRVRLLLVATLCLCGGLLLTGLSHGLGMLVLSKLIVGTGTALTYPTAMSLLADIFTPEKRSMGSLGYPIGQQLGTFSALVGGGLGYSALVRIGAAHPHLLNGLAPWRVFSLVFAAIGMTIVPLLLGLREPARMEQGAPGTGSFRGLWRHRDFLLPLFFGIMCLGGMSSGILTWFAPTLTRLYHLQPGDFAVASGSVILGSGLLSFVVAGLLVNRVRARWGNKALAPAAAITCLLCIPGTFAGTMPSVWGLAVLGATYQFFVGIAIWLPTMAINFRIPNEIRGLCMGAYVVLVAAAGMIGAPLVGYVSEALGGPLMIGKAIAAVGTPFAVCGAIGFWAAGRASKEDGNATPG